MNIPNRVRETTSTTGNGLTVALSAVAGRKRFSSESVGTVVPYVIEDADGINWELGEGTVQAGNTFDRTTVIESTNGGARIALSAGSHAIFVALKTDDLVYQETASVVSALGFTPYNATNPAGYLAAAAVAAMISAAAPAFAAADFNVSGVNVSIDYANGQKASASVPGFLTAADWTTFNAKASVAGSDTYVQFNDGGVLGGDAGLTYDKTTKRQYVGSSTGIAQVASDADFGGSACQVIQTEGDFAFNVIRTASGGAGAAPVPCQLFVTSRGTLGTPLAVGPGDPIGGFYFTAYDGSNYIYGPDIQVYTGSDTTAGTGTILFRVFDPTGAAANAWAWALTEWGVLSFGHPVGSAFAAATAPGLKGGGAGDPLSVRTYDDSAYAPFKALSFEATVSAAIPKLSNLTSNGLVTTSGGDGTLSVDTTVYQPVTLTTKGDLLGYSTALGRLGVGTDGHVLTADAASTFGFKWEAVAGGGATLGANTFTALQTITQASANAGILASTGYSLTGSDATAMVNLAGTWNTSGTPTAIFLNITNTASNAASKLIDLQVGGTTQFNVTRAGLLTTNGNINIGTSNPILQMGGNSILSRNGGTGAITLATTNAAFSLILSCGTTVATLLAASITLTDAVNLVVGTTTGTKIGTATGQKLGFWNATPVAQQVLATGAGATADNIITMLQTIGLCKQS